jgi:hypothetical protein
MSWNYRIDEERRFVITAAWDRLTGSEVIEHQRKLLNDTRFQRDFFQLLDFAGVIDFQMDRANVAELARFDLFSAKSRRAFFAPTPLAYGMSRMFIAFREASGQEQMQVFRDHNEALQWLGLHDSRMTAQ